MSFPPGRDSHPNHQKDQKQVGEAILGFPMWEGYGAIGASPVKHCEDGEGIETRLIQGDTGRASTVQTREEEMSKYLIEKKERARLFSVVSSGRTRDNHDKWKHKKFYPNTGKYVFTVKVVKERNRYCTERLQSLQPSEYSKPGHGHEQLALACTNRDWTKCSFWCHLWFYNSVILIFSLVFSILPFTYHTQMYLFF